MTSKLTGGPLGDLEKFTNEIFEQCQSAEKCKRGDPWDFLRFIVLQNIETNEGGPFDGIQKNALCQKIRVKNTKGGHARFSRFCTSMFLFWTRFWCFVYVLEVRSSSSWYWTKEQKSGPIALNWQKKLATVRVVHFVRKRRLKTVRFCLLRQNVISVKIVWTIYLVQRYFYIWYSEEAKIWIRFTVTFVCQQLYIVCLL